MIQLVETVNPWTETSDVGAASLSYLVALINLGRWSEADAALHDLLTVVRRAPDRYPPHRMIHAELAWGLLLLRRDYNGILEQLAPSIEADVPWKSIVNPVMVIAYRARGEDEKAVEMFLQTLDEKDISAVRRGYSEGGWSKMFRVVIEKNKKRGEMCHVQAYAELGKDAELFRCLAVPQQQVFFEFLWSSPIYDRYRNNPQFQALLDNQNVIGYKTCCPFTVEASQNSSL